MTCMSPQRSHPAPLQVASDPGDPTPVYFKLRNLLREALQSQEYPLRSRLPSEREMVRLYGVSRITVRRALDALAREGLIRRRRGRNGGTFVQAPPKVPPAPRFVGAFNAVLSTPQFRRIEIETFDMRAPNAEVEAALALPSHTPVRYVERRLFGALGPVALVHNFLPRSIGKRLPRRELGRMTLYQVLTRKLGVKIVEVHDEVEAVLADARAASRLGVRVGTAMLSIRRVYFAPGDEPVNFTMLVTRSDRYKMSVRLQDHPFE